MRNQQQKCTEVVRIACLSIKVDVDRPMKGCLHVVKKGCVSSYEYLRTSSKARRMQAEWLQSKDEWF
jgi:hypothetical protein